ncbi:Methyl viologen resistance protein SmvA [compost metagenome]
MHNQTQNHQHTLTPTSTLPAASRWLVLAIVSVALLLIVVDMTVLYAALPRLTADLQASASAKLWIVNIYALIVSGLLLGMGTLGDRLGHKSLFIAGLIVFGIASLCAAYSPSSAALIASRALLAVGAAMMMPATLSIIRLAFTDENERAVAIGIWASVAFGGAALGPVIGGLLLEYFWWGSVFLINVPIVLLALPIALFYIPKGAANKTRPWDLIGSLQIMAGLVGATYALKEIGKREPAWGIAFLVLLIGVVFLALFARRQQSSLHPMIDFSLFRNTIFSSSVAAAIIAGAALLGMELVFTQRLQLVLGMSPLQAGIFILPLSLAAFVAGPLTGRVLPRLGSAYVLTLSLFVAGVGMAAYLFLHNAAISIQLVCLIAIGAGIGAAMTAASSTIMQSAPVDRAGMAASIEEVSYELGSVVGVTLMSSILSLAYASTLILPADMNLPAIVWDSLDEALIVSQQLAPAAAQVIDVAAKASFDVAFTAVLAAASLMLFLTSGIVWWTNRKGERASTFASSAQASH